MSNEAKDLIKKMLTYDPRQRVSASDALQHPWMITMTATGKAPPKAVKQTLNNLQKFRV